MCAAAIPGNSLGEEIIVGGLQNFFQIFNNLLIGRVLLSWFPAAQSVGFLQPLFNVCDPYLGLFRNIIPPIGGIDLSPVLAFTFIRESDHVNPRLQAELSTSVQFRVGTASRHVLLFLLFAVKHLVFWLTLIMTPSLLDSALGCVIISAEVAGGSMVALGAQPSSSVRF